MARRELTEAEWLRRAIRHCEVWGRSSPDFASSRAHCNMVDETRLTDHELMRLDVSERETAMETGMGPLAGWLPEGLRSLSVSHLRARLAALESEAA